MTSRPLRGGGAVTQREVTTFGGQEALRLSLGSLRKKRGAASSGLTPRRRAHMWRRAGVWPEPGSLRPLEQTLIAAVPAKVQPILESLTTRASLAPVRKATGVHPRVSRPGLRLSTIRVAHADGNMAVRGSVFLEVVGFDEILETCY
jgi:hypothetical protein